MKIKYVKWGDMIQTRCPHNIKVISLTNRTNSTPDIVVTAGSWICTELCRYCKSSNTKEQIVICNKSNEKFII